MFCLLYISGDDICWAKGIIQIKGLHLTATRAYARKSAMIHGGKSGKRQLCKDPMENSQF
jgi:hypothetical protein